MTHKPSHVDRASLRVAARYACFCTSRNYHLIPSLSLCCNTYRQFARAFSLQGMTTRERGAAVSNEADEFRRVVSYMRRETASSIEKQPVTGKKVTDSARSGVPSWWREASGEGKKPVLFELHGGGFALGDARKGDAFRAWACERYGVHVVGLDYRLTPEHPWPAALEDVTDALEYYARNADDLRIDTEAYYLKGYSAGANHALASCLAAPLQDEAGAIAGGVDGAAGVGGARSRAGEPGYRIAGIALHYPFLDAAENPANLVTREEDLPASMMRVFNQWYVGENDPRNPLISPLYASDEQLRRLPRVLLYPVVGDALRGSAVRLHERLRALGVVSALHDVDGVYHGYVEDACNMRVYRETTLPETLAKRPAGFERTAKAVLSASLDELLGGEARSGEARR